MAKALVFIDADALVRHFVHSGALAELEAAFDVTYVFLDESEESKRVLFTDVDALNLPSVRKVQVSRQRMGQWYFLYVASVLRLQRGTDNYPSRRQIFVDIIGEKRTRLFEIIARNPIYPVYRWYQLRRMGRHAPIEQILDEEQPDVVIQPSFLTGHFINELLVSCPPRQIPHIVLMNSWDNPSIKAMSTGVPDRLVVWGEQSRDYARTYMGIPDERIESFGAAQFQVYRKPRPETDAELRQIFQVPDGKKILLYAGSGSGAYETSYLKCLEDLIESGQLADCHVLYRPHPWRGGLEGGEEDFFKLDWKHISMDPFMREFYNARVTGGDSRFFMLDYETTAQLLTLSTAVISPLSTILLEAAINGKPALVFSPEENLPVGGNLRQVHFRDFVGNEGILTSRSLADFPQQVQTLMDMTESPNIAKKLRTLTDRFVVMDGPSYAERLADLAMRQIDHSRKEA